MGRFGRKDAPRVVGFDFQARPEPAAWPAPESAPVPAAPAPVPQAVPVAAAPHPEWAVQPAPVSAAPDPSWAPPAMPGYGMPGPMSWQPPPAPAKSRKAPFVAAVVTLAVLGGGLFMRSLGNALTPLHTPVSVGGYARIHSPAIDAAESRYKSSMTLRKPVMGTYGAPLAPRFIVVAGDGSEDSSAEFWRGYAQAANKDGNRVGTSRKIGDLICAPMSVGRFAGGTCVWGGSRSDGAVMALATDDLDEVAQITMAARAEINR